MRGGSENTPRLGYQWDQRKCSAGGGLKVLAASLALNVPWQQVLHSTADGTRQASIKALSGPRALLFGSTILACAEDWRMRSSECASR